MTTRAYSNDYQPTLTEFKAHVRLTTSDMDTDLTLKLKAAIRAAEHYIGQIIARSVFTYTGPFVKTITLERPVQEVTSVVVDEEAVSDENWTLRDGKLTFADDITGTSMVITYTAGYTEVEPDVKAAILLHAAALFNNPVDSVEVLPKASTRLLDPYRTWGV